MRLCVLSLLLHLKHEGEGERAGGTEEASDRGI